MIPNFWIAECFVNLKPACDEIAVQPLTVQDSFVELPTTPATASTSTCGGAAQAPVSRHGNTYGQGTAQLYRGVPAQELRSRRDPHGLLGHTSPELHVGKGARREMR